MEVYISIDGVLRNFIQKFDYHYRDNYLNSEIEEGDNFQYGVVGEVSNKNLTNHYLFHSQDEFNHFTFLEYALEIFGHAGLSYSTAISDLNRIIHQNKNIKFTVVGIDELGKAKPSTLFFLSKNGFSGNHIKFITSDMIPYEWKNCDVWVTDSQSVVDFTPRRKQVVKFNTPYNKHVITKYAINNITKLEDLCLKFSESYITSILTRLSRHASLTLNRR